MINFKCSCEFKKDLIFSGHKSRNKSTCSCVWKIIDFGPLFFTHSFFFHTVATADYNIFLYLTIILSFKVTGNLSLCSYMNIIVFSTVQLQVLTDHHRALHLMASIPNVFLHLCRIIGQVSVYS